MKIDISINISFNNEEKEEFKNWVEGQVMDIRNWVQNMLEYGIELNPPLPQQYDAKTLEESKDEPEKEPEAQAEEKPNNAVAEDAAPEEENNKLIKLEDVRAKLAALSQAGKQEQVKALIQKFGAKKLTEIPKAKYPELLKEAEAL